MGQILDHNQNNINSRKNRKGIFLLFEGLPPTIIESQVLSHVRQMNQARCYMEVWTFAVTKHAYRHALARLSKLTTTYGVKIRLFQGIRPAYPFSRYLNAIILLLHILREKHHIKFIRARTDYSAATAAVLKPLLRFKLIWDARGDTLSESKEKIYTFNAISKIFAQFKLASIKNWIRVAARNCDRALFVSHALRNLQGRSLKEDKCLIIPCVADETLFYYDERIRIATRVRLGIKDDEIVMIYSGSVAPWQCVKETVNLMVSAITTNEKWRTIILTSSPDDFIAYIPQEVKSKFIVESVKLKDVNAFLNAADIAFMLRKKSPINWVASPVKFSEYSMAGLVVVTGNSVEQVKSIGQQISNIIDPQNFLKIGSKKSNCNHILAGRRQRAQRASQIYSRTLLTGNYLKLYECI